MGSVADVAETLERPAELQFQQRSELHRSGRGRTACVDPVVSQRRLVRLAGVGRTSGQRGRDGNLEQEG